MYDLTDIETLEKILKQDLSKEQYIRLYELMTNRLVDESYTLYPPLEPYN